MTDDNMTGPQTSRGIKIALAVLIAIPVLLLLQVPIGNSEWLVEFETVHH